MLRLIDDFSKATLSEWFTILRLAHLWRFTYVKAMALRYIKPKIDQEIPALVERIVKYEEYGTPSDILVPLYAELCKRDAPLDDSEWDLLESLPGKRLHRVVTVREKLAKLKGSAGSQPSDARVERNIGEALGLIERAAPAAAASSATSTFCPLPSFLPILHHHTRANCFIFSSRPSGQRRGSNHEGR